MDIIRTELANDIAKNSAPAGIMACFAMSVAPDGYRKADGSALSRSDYPALFAAIGTTFGEGDGSTTFPLPDWRGEFIRGWDDGPGTDTNRAFGTAQGDTIRNITDGFGLYGLQDCTLADGAFYQSGEKVSGYSHVAQGYTSDVGRIDVSRSFPSANENRPRNIALPACIKY